MSQAAGPHSKPGTKSLGPEAGPSSQPSDPSSPYSLHLELSGATGPLQSWCFRCKTCLAYVDSCAQPGHRAEDGDDDSPRRGRVGQRHRHSRPQPGRQGGSGRQRFAGAHTRPSEVLWSARLRFFSKSPCAPCKARPQRDLCRWRIKGQRPSDVRGNIGELRAELHGRGARGRGAHRPPRHVRGR